MSGGSKTVTTKSEEKRDPWAPAQPALQEILGGASAAYRSGAGQGVFQGDRTAGLGETTAAGLDAIKAGSAAGAGVAQGANGVVSGLLGSGGQTAGTKAATDAYAGIGGVDTNPTAGILSRINAGDSLGAVTARKLADGSYDLNTESDYRGILAGLSGPTQTQKSLQDVADGKFLGGANPYLDSIVSRSSASAASDVAQRFAASGRYGSGAFSNAIADAVSANEDRLRYADYDAERGRIAQAASAIDAAGNARTGLQQGILGAIGDVQTRNAGLALQGAQLGQSQDAQALAAAGQLAGQQAQNATLDATRASGLAGLATGDRAAALAAVGAVPGVQGGLLADGQTLAGIGAVQDAARQDDINADIARFGETDSAPWRALGLYSGLAAPIAGLGGTSSGTSTQQQPQPGVLQQVLGGGLATLGLLGRSGTGSILGSLLK